VGCRRPDVEQAIQKILLERPATYGYRRIHGMLKRQGVKADPKTVLGIMRRRGWLSSMRTKALRSARLHDGQVSVSEPNKRWATDITSIKAWNGEKGRLAVIVDCADRSVLTWRWGKRMLSEDLQEMVREAVFRRLGVEREKARGLEFLSDNGPEFACKKLRSVLVGFGIVPCRTPRRSPESNGLVERFFGTFKRDYVYQGELESLDEIGRKLPGWIQDYNEVAPHSALKMKAPAQFYRDWLASATTKRPVQI
jgi:putative transposase